jgi:hypothetical protein
LPAAGQTLLAIGVTKLELGGQGSASFGQTMLLAVRRDAEKGKHQRLEIRNGHANPS